MIKPKFWDYKKPNVYSYFLWPISILIRLFNFLKILITRKNYSSTKTICVGNIYLGGTGKTSLSLKINEILRQKKIKTIHSRARRARPRLFSNLARDSLRFKLTSFAASLIGK